MKKAESANEAKSPRSRYRKVEVKTWGDEKFQALSPMPPCGQGLWLFLITGPHTSPIPGLFRAGRAAMAEDLGWDLKAFDEAFGEAFQQGMVKADFKARVVWIPKAISHNKPESPNVVKSWSAEFDLIPECDLKREAYESLKASIHALGEAYGKAFDESFSKPSPKPSGKPSPKPSAKTIANQEQEQEQEYSEAKASAAIAAPATPLTAKERVWLLGPPLLGEKARGLLGKLASTYTDDVLAEVLAQATVEKPIEPKAWVTAACEARAKKPKTNGRHVETVDLLSDPKPEWATGAGFPDRFQAENAGCGPGNWRKFRDGQRVAA